MPEAEPAAGTAGDGVAGILAIVSLIKPTWPLVAVAVLLVCVALLMK